MHRLFLGASLLLIVASRSGHAGAPPMQIPAPPVDIPRYMGDWYVIASIPTRLEKHAFNAVESYALDDDGTIRTTFTFRQGGFDGKPKRITARGFVKDPQVPSVWGMRFIWPIKSDYRIAWIAADYSQVVVAREKRDYVWIMARTPRVDPADLTRLKSFAQSLGYDAAKLRDVPQNGAPTPPAP